MSKLDKRGFMLAEVVVVAVVVATTLVALYTGLSRVSSAYEKRNKYYDIDALYYAMAVNDNYDKIESITDAYKSLGTDTKKTYISAEAYKIEYKDAALDSLKTSVSNQTFKDYIEYLKGNTDFSDSNYTNFVITELCKTSDDCYYYALKVGDNNE